MDPSCSSKSTTETLVIDNGDDAEIDRTLTYSDIELGVINKGYEDDNNDCRAGEVELTLSTAPTISLDGISLGGDGSVAKSSGSGDENDKRSTTTTERDRVIWDSPLEFLLSCIAMSVGLGNVWRFPFVAYSNGGGAFLIPYLVVLSLIGRPLYYLEMCLGQFSQIGPVEIWRLSPLFKGIGYSSMMAATCIMTFYCSIIAITIFYLYASFWSPLPWTQCQFDWGEEYCSENGSFIGSANVSLSQLYFKKTVTENFSNIDDGIGLPLWHLTLCLFLTWCIIFLVLIRGVKSSGKVAYVTALFPYVVMFILLIRGVTLEGAFDGIYYFIRPRWESLIDPNVWFAAVSQCFFSLSTGLGTIIMLSSYNPFSHNVYRDAMIISITDTFTSVLAGVTIFSVLGSLAKTLDVDISEVAEAGPGLAFVSYPEAIAKMGFIPQAFAVLFFLMLLALGVGSATSLAGGIISMVCDWWPKLPPWKATLPVCVFGFITGLLYVTPGGGFMLTLVNHYGADYVIYIAGMMEAGVISWVYGLDNICKDIEFMSGRPVGWYWRACWGYCIPIGLCSILIYSTFKSSELLHEDVAFPISATVCGWILGTISLSFLPICAIIAIRASTGASKDSTLKERVLLAMKPSETWGPRDCKVRLQWKEYINNCETKQ